MKHFTTPQAQPTLLFKTSMTNSAGEQLFYFPLLDLHIAKSSALFPKKTVKIVGEY